MSNRIIQLEAKVIPSYNGFDRNFYACHILPVRKFSKRLASEFKQDILLCDVSALLHDLGLALYGDNEHNISGLEESMKLLKLAGFGDREFNLVARMIINHNGNYSTDFTLEDEVLRSADGMAHISEMPYTFHSYLIRNNYKEAKKKTKNKLLFEMEQKITIPLAKNMISKEYELAINLLN